MSLETLRSRKEKHAKQELLFGRQHYMIILAGLALVILGFVLMSGGSMPEADVWEPERIYSFRRISLAPIVVLSGLGLVIYGIFRKSPQGEAQAGRSEEEESSN